MSKTAKEILLDAKDILRMRGWTQGALQSGNGCVCLEGALNAAVTGNPCLEICTTAVEPPAFEARRALRDAVGVATGGVTRNIVQWNDEEGRRVSQVLEVLDTAIAIQARR